ncbi:biotin--[acetyl-CoA-carboxylase] ligase [Metaclostridioides mangenotii]|uniref:biotin--[acetyl-CoA-carboxylase] ligase n=1 Tax=Metaclostridioides mangenotii TaxID=1540 RepID=UPI00046514C5|nr:biotin--[acetyl-CoA-carboxylase] ligase [Clostridioides mangenotii]
MDIKRIKNNIGTDFIGQNILYLDTVNSTNLYAKKIAKENTHGTLIISEEQTAGKGRLGKNWTSNFGEGIWMTIILKPEIKIQNAPFLTLVAGAAVAKSLNSLGLEALIKWPNDITLNNKKICGILTELSAENESVSYIVLGMGINVNTLNFDKEISAKATSILKEGYKIDREIIILNILEEFEKIYKNYVNACDKHETLALNRRFSAIIGKNVYIIESGVRKLKICLDINEDGNLLVQDEDGSITEVNSGEVSVRGEGGYV